MHEAKDGAHASRYKFGIAVLMSAAVVRNSAAQSQEPQVCLPEDCCTLEIFRAFTAAAPER
jgi:hypothetical protein